MYPRMSEWFFLFLFACVATLIRCELFSSMAHLETAIYAERDIAIGIHDYILKEESRIKKLRKVAEELEEHSAEVLSNKENYLHNPVNAYLYMKKFTIDWDKNIAPLFQRDSDTDVLTELEDLKSYLPNYEDLHGSVAALLRLQDTYKLNTNDLAHGMVGPSKSLSMSAIDCFELGKISYEEEDYYHTSLWMEEGLSLLKREKNQTAKRQDMLDYLAFSVYKQGNVRKALILTDELLNLVPSHTRAQNNRKYYERILKENDETQDDQVKEKTEDSSDYRQSEEFQTYEKLCRGETTKVNKDEHRMKCRYHNNNHPALLIQPVKEEEKFLNPFIVVYHNVMSDYEIEVIKDIAKPKLDRATVHNAKTGQLETANYRVSKSAWLKDSDHKVIQRVNNRIEAVTGLNMETAEDLQIANYGLGGHYEPHFDFARKEEKHAFKSLGTGNRIATWLTYMTDVEAGGATVFPNIGVKLFPQKGSAAFWYNLYKSGDGIYDTRHAACPVLVGHKWVSNKWIHERGQEFRRPCGLRSDE